MFSLTNSERNRCKALISSLFVLALLGGCATTVITPELEGQMGSQASREVEEKIGTYQDDALEAYLIRVGRRLVMELDGTPYNFEFAIVDQADPNAFASPGGYIYISRGLLAQMNSEAELAGVLAHEISHVTQRHHTRQIGRSVGAGLFTLPGRAVGVISEDLGNMINTPVEAAGQVYLSSYSRGQETEADEYGMALAARAGYEPIALVSALKGLERSVEYQTGKKHQASFFDTHPATPERIADINRKSVGIDRQLTPPIADDAELAARLNGLWWGPQNPQQGIFRGQVYLNADFDFRLDFAEDWKTVNTPRYVAAQAPDGGAYIVFGGGDPDVSILELADKMESRMREGAGLEPAERNGFTIGDWPAQVLRYDDNSGDETVSLYYLFVAANEISFTVMSMGLERYRDDLRDTVMSLRQLDASDRASIQGLRIRLATPEAGETFAELGARVGNAWSPELTAIVNGLETDELPMQGEPLKVARQETYRPK